MLVVSDLTVTVGQRTLIDQAAFTTPRIGVLSISGPSGSGKSVLLEVLGGIRTAAAGHIQLNNRPVRTRDVSWIPQRPLLIPQLSVLENALIGQPRCSQSAVLDALRAVGLDEPDKPARQLSGGEAQRLCFARSSIASTPIVLADEPTGQLDARISDTVLSSLHQVANSRLVIVVTHDPVVAGSADIQLRIRDGHLVQC